MKKQTRKLALHRETLRDLDGEILGGIAVGGGYTYNIWQCGTSCDCLDSPGTFSAYCTEECPTTC
jgi:hypothetical protein